MARYMRTDLGRGHSKLSGPAVVGAGVYYRGIQVYYAQAVKRSAPGPQRREPFSVLRPPQVVTPAPVQIYFGPRVYLNVMAPERLRRTVTNRAPTFFLRPPQILATNGPSQYSLAYSRRGRPKSFLRPPTDTIGLEDQGRIRRTLVSQHRTRTTTRLFPPTVVDQPVVAAVYYGPKVGLVRIRPPRVRSTYVYPIVIASPTEAFGYLAVNLVRIRPPAVRSFLRPAVIQPVVQVYYGPDVTLTRIRPRRTRTFLRPPAILQTNLPTATTLAPQRRGRPKSRLAPPVVVFLAVEIYGPETTLAPQRRGAPTFFLRPPADTVGLEDQGRVTTHLTNQHRTVARSHLQPPAVVRPPDVFLGPEVTLVRNKPQPTTSFLKPFTERAFEVSLGPEAHLAPSRFPVPKSRLEPPAVVGQVVYSGPTTSLAYSRRGRPIAELRPPQVVQQPPAYQQVVPPTFAYQRRGRPIYELRPPVVVFPFFARPTVTSLAPQTRGRPLSHLSPPAILRSAGLLLTTLAPQRRGKAKPFLRPPVVVRLAVEIYGPETALAYSRRSRPRSFLAPPEVVGRVPFRGILTHLTYSRRGRPKSFLRPGRVGFVFRPIEVTLARNKPKPTTTFLRAPTVVRIPVFGVPQVHLTRITHPPVQSNLRPPVVVGAGIAFFGPSITLIRIVPPPVHYDLRFTLVAFRRPQGDVCGMDIAGSFVCAIGTSRAGSTVTGSDSAGGSVSGSDRKAT